MSYGVPHAQREVVTLTRGPAQDTLPLAVDAQYPLTADELHVLQQQYDQEYDRGHLSVQTKFNLAWWGIASHPL